MPDKNIHIVGIDSGGTFTDFVYYDGKQLRSHKVLSTPQQPEAAIIEGLEQLEKLYQLPLTSCEIVHGSTVATNAALEGKGAKTAYVTNLGFADTLTIGRQARSELYALEPSAPPVPVAPEYCFEINTRMNAQGEVLTPVDDTQLKNLITELEATDIEAVAINLLFSFIDNSDEQRISAALPSRLFISCSADVLAEYKEYERGIATWLNAYVGPVIKRYLSQLKQQLTNNKISIMLSSGGTTTIEQCAQKGVELLLSGPAGGLVAAHHIAQQCDQAALLSFDMGGTSTDVAIVVDHEIQLTNEGSIGPYPLAIPTVDIHTIGAGGGSIAWLDEGGLLQVGPQSAGADPGPACYNLGGTQATITDANLVLGRLPRETRLAGHMQLSYDAAANAIEKLAKPLGLSVSETAVGIIRIAEQHMSAALRKIAIPSGQNPKHFTLTCFGGAGGLHICNLAESLGIQRAIVPNYAGVLSAFGMLVAEKRTQYSRTVTPDVANNESHIEQLFLQLVEEAIADLEQQHIAKHEIKIKQSVDMRYKGQSFCLNVAWQGMTDSKDAFKNQHQRRYGHILENELELVTVRVQAVGPRPNIVLKNRHNSNSQSHRIRKKKVDNVSTVVFYRSELTENMIIVGPAIICEETTTSYIAKGWQAKSDKFNNLCLDKID